MKKKNNEKFTVINIREDDEISGAKKEEYKWRHMLLICIPLHRSAAYYHILHYRISQENIYLLRFVVCVVFVQGICLR